MDATDALTSLFPKCVSIALASANDDSANIWPDEAIAIRGATKRRQTEFAAGRTAARSALSQMGHFPTAIGVNPDRTPRWPPGIVGSITHCDGFCGAVVAKECDVYAIGLDAETITTSVCDIQDYLFSSREQEHFASLAGPYNWPLLAFSAKEAFYKSFYPRRKTMLAFLDVRIEFAPATTQLTGAYNISSAQPQIQFKRQHGNWALYNSVAVTSCISLRGS